MSQKALVEFYGNFLNSICLYPDDDGLISLQYPDSSGEIHHKPATVNGKRLVLPIPKVLRESDWDDVIAFHPLSENLLRGESEVIKMLKTTIIFRLMSVSAQLMTELMEIASDPSRHEELNTTQSKFLSKVPDANEKCLKILGKILTRHAKMIVSIYLKREAKLGDDEFRRVAMVTFPIAEELERDDTMIFDVDCGSKKNKRTIAAMFDFVFPDYDDVSAWSAGSTSQTCPYFDSLARAYAHVGSRLNKLTKMYKKFLDHYDLMHIDLDWTPSLDTLKSWSGRIPALPGNEGALMRGETEKPASSAKPNYLASTETLAEQKHNPGEQTSTQPPQPPQMGGGNPPPMMGGMQQQPMQQHMSQTNHQPTSAGRGVDWRSVSAAMRTQQPQQQMYGHHAVPHAQMAYGTAINPPPPVHYPPNSPVTPTIQPVRSTYGGYGNDYSSTL